MTFLNKFTYIIDEIFKLITIFLLSFIWSLYYFKELGISLIVSSVISIILLSILHIVFSIKSNNKEKSKGLEKEKQNFKETLLLSTSTDNLNYFSSIFVDYENKGTYLQKQDEIILPFVNKLELSYDDLLLLITSFSKNAHLTIICHTFSPNCSNLATRLTPLKVDLVKSVDTFTSYIYNKKEKPESELTLKSGRLYTLKQLLSTALSRGKSKKYLFAALLLILTMFFVPYKIYYIVISTLLLLLSLLSRLNIFK